QQPFKRVYETRGGSLGAQNVFTQLGSKAASHDQSLSITEHPHFAALNDRTGRGRMCLSAALQDAHSYTFVNVDAVMAP
ncbi:hypothetical protein, partial [Pseudomonas sp. OA65]|uniref:hypothetical protein n=1 Tax=Pseudomonas sp. OA65 TaxID=2818431 RepID=UPI001A9DFCF2